MIRSKNESEFKELLNFLNKTVKVHQIKKGDTNFPHSQFISVDGFIQKDLIEDLIKCLIEQGKRRFIGKYSPRNEASEPAELVKNWVKSEKEIFDSNIQESFDQIIEGEPFTFPIVTNGLKDNPIDVIRESAIFDTIESLKKSILKAFESSLKEKQIKKELLLKKSLFGSSDFPPFIETPYFEKFLKLYEYLISIEVLKTNLIDFSDLFTGKIPKEKVIFESAYSLEKVRYLMVYLDFRSLNSYSLEKNFAPHVDFLNHTKGNIKNQLKNAAKNKKKFSEKSKYPEFPGIIDFLAKINHQSIENKDII